MIGACSASRNESSLITVTSSCGNSRSRGNVEVKKSTAAQPLEGRPWPTSRRPSRLGPVSRSVSCGVSDNSCSAACSLSRSRGTGSEPGDHSGSVLALSPIR